MKNLLKLSIVVLFLGSLTSCIPSMYGPVGGQFGAPYGYYGQQACYPAGNPTYYAAAAARQQQQVAVDQWYASVAYQQNFNRLARTGGLAIGLQPQPRFRTVMEAVQATGQYRGY